MSMTRHFLKRPEAQPSLDECWESPPSFRQSCTKKAEEEEEELEQIKSGMNAQWRVDLCLYKRHGFHLPSVLAYARAQVLFSVLTIKCRGARGLGQVVKVPLVWISFIELVEPRECGSRRRPFWHRRRLASARLLIRGRGLFRMTMLLSAQDMGELFAIRDWLRFLVVRQRIPHLVLGLQFDWAKEKKKSVGCRLKEFVANKFDKAKRYFLKMPDSGSPLPI